MKIGDEEYLRLRDVFMKEEFNKDIQKPSGMIGNWGWFVKKEREFQSQLREQGKLKE
jgi:hypothetical protein